MTLATLFASAVLGSAALLGAPEPTGPAILARLTPQPQRLDLREGHYPIRDTSVLLAVPEGSEYEACRMVLAEALRAAGARVEIRPSERRAGNRFTLGAGAVVPPLSEGENAKEGYSLAIGAKGACAVAGSPAGLLYAAQTLRQLSRAFAEQGRMPALGIVDTPESKMRGIYIEGGQERFGRIVDKDYLCEQIRRLAEFKMNMLVIECYNLFPFASFPACADSGTLGNEDCRQIVAEAKRYHVTIVPSLQTLAQASELVWACDAGKPYREPTSPGQMCPSTPEVYPFVKRLYRDLLRRFDTTPVIGIGCSEIEMQWQGRYCPKCQARLKAGETPRGLLLGHAEKCIQAVRELAQELRRPVRPLLWADEFYMYGPGKDWVGIERIPRDTVMGYWKYWSDYQGIGGLLERGYDVLGISAMYNHTFYLADLSPASPRKQWPSMEQTGTRNIVEMVQEAVRCAGRGRDFSSLATGATSPEQKSLRPTEKSPPGRKGKPLWLGVATASFSKHRLRAFDSIWYGFALNGHCTWSHGQRPLGDYQAAFTRAFVGHYYDCRTEAAGCALTAAWTRLDECKSSLELANQTLRDVIGVYDTQEPGYQGNSLLDALRRCRDRTSPAGELKEDLAKIRAAALKVQATVAEVRDSIRLQRAAVTRTAEVDDLLQAAEKIAVHAEREVLLIDAQRLLARAPRLAPDEAATLAAAEAKRWAAHRARTEAVARVDARLYRQGDPCGHALLLRDVATIESHLSRVAKGQSSQAPGQVLLDERFERLDPTRWIILGKPQIAKGRLETRVAGGWENRCGIATREAFALDEVRPLVIEFTLTPLKMGIDSQIFGSATETGIDSYRFSFYGPVDHFGVYTHSEGRLAGPWLDVAAGWHPRSESGAIALGKEYRVCARITRKTFQVTVRATADTAWDVPLWDSGEVPMAPLACTRVRFADVEPEGGAAATRWGNIVVRRP